MRKKLLRAAIWLLFAASCASAVAAVTGVRITEVDNLSLGSWLQSSVNGDDPVCVYRNSGGNTYTVLATDSSTLAPGGFFLENGPVQIPYTVKWSNTPAPGTALLNDGVLKAATGANTASATCNGGDSANFRIDVNNSAMAAVPAGTYKATITFQIGQ